MHVHIVCGTISCGRLVVTMNAPTGLINKPGEYCHFMLQYSLTVSNGLIYCHVFGAGLVFVKGCQGHLKWCELIHLNENHHHGEIDTEYIFKCHKKFRFFSTYNLKFPSLSPPPNTRTHARTHAHSHTNT